jgi:hypothetical protein
LATNPTTIDGDTEPPLHALARSRANLAMARRQLKLIEENLDV